MIASKFTKSVAVQRMTWATVDGIDSSSLTTIGTISGHLQQASIEEIQNLTGNMTLTHNLYCPCGSNIAIGDTVTIDSNPYGVRAVHDYCFIGHNKHLKVLLEKQAA